MNRFITPRSVVALIVLAITSVIHAAEPVSQSSTPILDPHEQCDAWASNRRTTAERNVLRCLRWNLFTPEGSTKGNLP